LSAATCRHEDGIVSNRESARHGEFFLSFAHTARHVMGVKMAGHILQVNYNVI